MSPHESNRRFYDRISQAYDFIADSNEHAARERGENEMGLSAGDRVLEIGFGTGNSAINLARLVSPGGQVHGIDISPGMLEVANKKVAASDVAEAIELQVGDARQLPFEDGTFDGVFTSFTLELFPLEETPQVLQEAHRVLRPGGRLGVVSMAVVAEGEHESLLEKAYVWMHRHFPHIVDCSPIDAAAVVKQAGFEVIKEIELKIWTMPVAVVIGQK